MNHFIWSLKSHKNALSVRSLSIYTTPLDSRLLFIRKQVVCFFMWEIITIINWNPQSTSFLNNLCVTFHFMSWVIGSYFPNCKYVICAYLSTILMAFSKINEIYAAHNVYQHVYSHHILNSKYKRWYFFASQLNTFQYHFSRLFLINI